MLYADGTGWGVPETDGEVSGEGAGEISGAAESFARRIIISAPMARVTVPRGWNAPEEPTRSPEEAQ